MLGISTLPENPGAAAVGEREKEGSGGGSVSGVFGEEERLRGDEGDRNLSGNRWPREETLALLRIRSDMDVAFRDSTLKAPLWDEVSRKLTGLGYHRSAKKCKEKFENIYKYHRRTKDGRSGRPSNKTYRFFDQLEVFETNPSLPPPSDSKPDQTSPTAAAMIVEATAATPPTNPPTTVPPCIQTTSTASDLEGRRTSTKKRKLSDFFERLMKQVVEKQENLQKKLLEALEKYERDRLAREEEWKTYEVARIKREQELLVQERSMAAAKDAAVIAFLQKVSEQSNHSPIQLKQEMGSHESYTNSSSRWPKVEVEALIKLRTNYDHQYQENGPKGSLWEEISAAMKKLGYDRNPKRCKEKWENINKYFKRVKESNKTRPEDSKTCPYFHHLDALYKEKWSTSKNKVDMNSEDNSGNNFKPEELLMQMMGRHNVEHQQQQQQRTDQSDGGGGESDNVDQNGRGGDDEDEEDDENETDNYRIVANDSSSMAIMG